MAILTTLADLFESAVVGMAEQFVRGHASFPTFGDMMRDRFGDDYQVPELEEKTFVGAVMQASRPAAVIQAGGIPDRSIIPDWVNGPNPGKFIHTGLAKISLANSEGDIVFASRILMQLEEAEILKLQEAQQRILDALNQSDEEQINKYEGDFDRIDDLIAHKEILNSEYQANVEMYSVFAE